MLQSRTRTAADYLRSLDDHRRVYVDGVPISSVLAHEQLSPMAHTLAQLFEHPLWVHASDSLSSPLWDPSHHPGQLRDKGQWYRGVAALTGGLLGRSPDFLAAIVTAWSVNAHHFQDRGERVRAFWQHCRHHNQVLAHAISDPPAAQHQLHGSPLLKVVARTSEGIVVRGMKMLATLGPYADFLLVYPYRQLLPEESDAALCFAVPLSTPGLKLHARPGMHMEPGALSGAFDESDAIVEFDDVLVPDEYVFIDGIIERANGIRAGTHMTTYAWHQSVARVWAKARLMAESAKRGAEHLNKKSPATQARIADLYATARILDALLSSAEANFVKTENGTVVCDHSALSVAVTHYAASADQWVETLSDIYGSALVIRPDRHHGQAREDVLSRFYKTDKAAEATFDMAFAHDMTSTPYGRRQVLYEKAFVGPTEVLRAKELGAYAKGEDLVLPYFTHMCGLINGGKNG